MTSENDYSITESDLAIFPPYLSFFLLATICLMVSHGLAATIIFFFYLTIPPGLAFGLVMASGMAFVVFNVAVIRGHTWGVSGLKALAALYILIAISSFAWVGQNQVNVKVSLAVLVSSGSAWLTLRSVRYQAMAGFLVRRWRFYRDTGRTVIEELERQRRSDSRSTGYPVE